MKTFKMGKNRVFINESMVSDGHVLFQKEIIPQLKNKSLQYYSLVPKGTYSEGVRTSDNCPNIQVVIDSALRGATKKVDLTVDTLIPCGKVLAVRLRGQDFPVYINQDFYPLLDLGDKVMGKDSLSPLVVFRNEKIIAVVMPLRHSHALDKYEFPPKEKVGAL